MKKVILGLVAISLIFASCKKDEISPLGIVFKGTITDSKTGQPVESATLKVMVGDTEKTATTDANGKYKFERIPSGVYNIIIEKEGYLESIEESTALAPTNKNSEEVIVEHDYTLAPLTEKLLRTVYKKRNYSAIGTAAANIEFTYTFGYNEKIMTGKTDENGLINLENIPFGLTITIVIDFIENGHRFVGRDNIYFGNTENSIDVYLYSGEGDFGITNSNVLTTLGESVEDFAVASNIEFNFTLPVDTANAYIDFTPEHKKSWANSNTKLIIDPVSDLDSTTTYNIRLSLSDKNMLQSLNENINFGTVSK